MIIRNTILTLLLLAFLGTCVRAQETITITGRVLETGSEAPIEFATILLADATSGTSLGGTTTDLDGNFELASPQREVYLEISFIGMESRRIEAGTITNGRMDLGTVSLKSQGQNLEEVTVRAEKSTTEFKLDKRVFNVGQDLASAGAGALEVLNNVPSVNVTIEGQVQLRGAGGVQILIDGKPSVIASEQGNLLGTITADMIESIEVITNPSAKYDAEGTSGIINIVLKKEEKKGLNGALSVNAGVPDNYSVGLSLNRRTEKFNLFSQLGVGYRELPNDERTENRDKQTGITVFSEGREFRNEQFYNVVLGADYHLDEYNVFTLSGNFAYEIEDQPSDFTFSRVAGPSSLLSRWERSEVTEATNPKYQFEFQYVRDFKDDEDHNLIFSALGSLFQKDQSSDFTNTTLEGDDNGGRQRTATNFGTQTTTIKLDYVRPLDEVSVLEAGG
ncbi:MAG: carboxypeptidase-like regulatory domain-containing protein, partial [Bacteroidota bacterium]